MPLIKLRFLLIFLTLTSCKEELATSAEDASEAPVKKEFTPNSNELFTYKKSFLNPSDTQPISITIDIYKAQPLELGEHYHDLSQLNNATKLAELEFDLNAFSEATQSSVTTKHLNTKISTAYSSNLKIVDLTIALNLKDSKSIQTFSCSHHFFSKFDQAQVMQLATSAEQTIVCVYTIKQLDWKPQAKKKTVAPKRPKQAENDAEHDPDSDPFGIEDIEDTLRFPQKATLAPLINPSSRGELTLKSYKAQCAIVKRREYKLQQITEELIDLEQLPRIKQASDEEVYDLAQLFNHVISDDNQWVHYNRTKEKIITKSDAYLSASVSAFILQNQPFNATQLRFSAELIEVDAKASINLDDLKKRIKQGQQKNINPIKRITKFSYTTQSGIHEKMRHQATEIDAELTLNDRYNFYDIRLNIESEDLSINVTDTFRVNESKLVQCGLSKNGKTKMILLTQCDLLDSKGKVIDLSPAYRMWTRLPNPVNTADENDQDDPFSSDPFSETELQRYGISIDLIDLIYTPADGEYSVNLITTPIHPYFEPGDVVFDLSQMLIKSGIPLKKFDFCLINQSKNECIIKTNQNNIDIILSLLSPLGFYTPRSYSTAVSLFEVDSRSSTDTEWTTNMLALSNPKPILNVGFMLRSGEKSVLKNGDNSITLETTLGDYGYTADQSYYYHFKTKDWNISKQINCISKLDHPSFIEIEDNGKRAIIGIINMTDHLKRTGQNSEFLYPQEDY